jgi:hypothetical protein
MVLEQVHGLPMAVDQDLSEAATTGDAAAHGLRGSFACAPRGRDGRLRYPERGRRKSPPSADDNRTTGSDDVRMSDELTVTRVVLEPAAQAFADATADPPCLFELGLVEGLWIK